MLRTLFSRGFSGAVFLLVILPGPAVGQDGVQVDPNSPAGQEYAIPLEEARRGGGFTTPDEGASTQSAPLFGEGIGERARDGGSAEPGTGAGSAAADAGRARGDAGSGDRGTPAATRQATSAAAAAAGSGTAGTLAIAGGVLAIGLLLGFGLGRLRAD